MFTIRSVIFSMTMLLFVACKTQQISQEDKLATAIEAFMGSGYTSEENSSKTLLLTWTMNNSNDTPVLKYAVWNIATSEKLYAGTAIRGKISWLAEMTLELYDYPGIIDDNNPLYRYKIDLKTKTKTAFVEKNEL